MRDGRARRRGVGQLPARLARERDPHVAAAAVLGTFADVDSVSASGSYRVSAKSDLFVTASQSRFDGKQSLGIFTGLSVAVGQHSTAGMSIEHQDGKTVAAADMHRSLPLGEGFGYRLRAEGGESALVDGELEYQTRFGRTTCSSSTWMDRP